MLTVYRLVYIHHCVTEPVDFIRVAKTVASMAELPSVQYRERLYDVCGVIFVFIRKLG